MSLFLGASLSPRSGALAGHRLAVEAGRPLMRDLNGPQMDPGWSVVVGWQFGLRTRPLARSPEDSAGAESSF